MGNPLQLKSLNHVSIMCRSLEKSIDFYQNILGFIPIKRPSSFDFNGAWLFNYGIGIHLLQSEDPESMPKINSINPTDNHISFKESDLHGYDERSYTNKYEFHECLRVPLILDSSLFICECESISEVESKLKDMKIEYVKRRIGEDGVYVDQLFFHDPDASMIEICNCDSIPVAALSENTVRSCCPLNCFVQQHHQINKWTQ